MITQAAYEVVFFCESNNPYQQMETRQGIGYNRRLINGKITSCGKCVGYCQFRDHPGFLTKEQRKEHDCLGKQCFYYIPKQRSVKTQAYINPVFAALASL